MVNCWLTSDNHFCHDKAYTFLKPDGTKMRPFSNAEEGDAFMVEQWNKLVKPKDRIYVLGDVAIKRSGLKILEQLNGRKVLVRGNHDIFKLKDYAEHFDDIRGCFYHHEFMMSHIPLHPELFEQRFKGNIHGHLHCHNVRLADGSLDRRYFNTCVEQNNFAPFHWDEAMAWFAQ
jgi:calcineurin-like phosphoesterase family protein